MPRAIPPKVSLYLREISQRITAAQVILFDGEGAGGLAAVECSVLCLGGEGGVDGIGAARGLDFKTDVGAVGKFSPFVGSKDGVGWGNGGARVQKLDLSPDVADDQLRAREGGAEIGAFAGDGLFRSLPKWFGGGD